MMNWFIWACLVISILLFTLAVSGYRKWKAEWIEEQPHRKAEEERREKERQKIRKEEREKAEEELRGLTNEMTQRPCPINESKKCFNECVHFQEGDITCSSLDFCYAVPPSCKLWRER